MRKIQPSLNSEGYDNFKDLVSTLALPKSSNLKTVGAFNCDYTSLYDALIAAAEDDILFVYPGVYAAPSGQYFPMKSVSMYFFGNVVITSDNNDGTFYDEGETKFLRLYGNVRVNNSAGRSKFFIEGDSQVILSQPIGPYTIQKQDGTLVYLEDPTIQSPSMESGDAVYFAPGEHNFGAYDIVLRDQCHYIFPEGTIITGSSEDGVFNDGNQEITAYFHGTPKIKNTSNNCLAAGVRLKNSNSKLFGYHPYIIFKIEGGSTEAGGVYITPTYHNLHEDVVDAITATKLSTGYYKLTFDSTSPASYNFFIPYTEKITYRNGNVIKALITDMGAAAISIKFYDGNNTAIHPSNSNMEVKIDFYFGKKNWQNKFWGDGDF